MTQDDLALLRLLAAGGASAPRRRLLERYGSPARAIAAGNPGWRDAGPGRRPGPRAGGGPAVAARAGLAGRARPAPARLARPGLPGAVAADAGAAAGPVRGRRRRPALAPVRGRGRHPRAHRGRPRPRPGF